MIKCVYSIAAKGIIRDVETNTMSIYNVYDEIIPQSFPVLLSNFEFLAMFWREPGDPPTITHNIRITLDEDELFTDKMDSVFGDKMGNRLKFRINGLAILHPGKLTVTLTGADGSIECEYYIKVASAPSKILPPEPGLKGIANAPQASEESKPK